VIVDDDSRFANARDVTRPKIELPALRPKKRG
jgi:hypothetical protein